MTREVILHRLVRLILVVVILSLAPAAYASPPDQSWIPGLYDNADFDDIVLLITSNPLVRRNRAWSGRCARWLPSSVSLRRWPPSRGHSFLCHLFSVALPRSPRSSCPCVGLVVASTAPKSDRRHHRDRRGFRPPAGAIVVVTDVEGHVMRRWHRKNLILGALLVLATAAVTLGVSGLFGWLGW